jgi:pilus assembly protein CpaF
MSTDSGRGRMPAWMSGPASPALASRNGQASAIATAAAAAPEPAPRPVQSAPVLEVMRATEGHSQMQELKGRVHRQLLDRMNLSQIDSLEREQVIAEIRRVVQELLQQETTPLNFEERAELVTLVVDEIFGYGPLEPLLKDDGVSDILVNGYSLVYVERDGRLYQTDVRFKDNRHLLQIIDRIVSGVGRRIDEATPLVDARLPDGSRVNAIIPPLAIDGPALSIRKFKRDALCGADLVRNETLSGPMLDLLQGVVRARLNVLISGGTGAGKTTLLNTLSSYIAADERIVTIEDSAELQLLQRHVVRLETRPANVEGKGEVTQRLLLINALRMRPDRVLMGEVRGGEAVDMLQAMNTGHDGSITTLHANSPRDALGRLETMISMSSLELSERAMRQQIASAIDVVIQISRLSDGKRKVMSIAEVIGMEGDMVTMQEIFVYDRQGVSDDGAVVGRFRATGIRPKFAERFQAYGIALPAGMFSDSLVRGGAA